MQDISKLTDGKAVYCQLPNKNGGLIDDLIIYKLEDEKYIIVKQEDILAVIK